MKGFQIDNGQSKNIKDSSSIKKIYDKAVHSHQNGDLIKAKEYYNKCIEKGMNTPSLLCNYAVLFKQQGNIKKAINLYKKSIKLYPEYSDTYHNYGNLLYIQKNLDEAEIIIGKAITLKPESSVSHYLLAQILIEKKKFIDAKYSLQKVILLNEKFVAAYLKLSEVLILLKDNKEAKKILLKLIKISPNSAEPYVNLGAILMDSNEFEEAEKVTQKAITLNPNLSEAYHNLGSIYRENGKLNESESFVKKAIKINPKYTKGLSLLGTILLEKNEPEAAKISWLKALEYNPKLNNVIFKLGKLYYHEQNYTEAIKYFEKDNNENSKVLYLGCLLSLDRKLDFYRSYKIITNQNIYNAELGGIIEHANIIYQDNLTSNFCNKAMNYIMFDQINSDSLPNEFFNQLIEYFKDTKNNKKHQPILKSGTQTSGDLFTLKHPFIQCMKQCLEEKISKYKLKYKDSQESFIKNWPKDYVLRSWMIGMKKGGYLKQHNHGYGWITGSFYLEVPSMQNNDCDAGNIAFSYQGPYYPDKGKDFCLSKRQVQVRDICLFPSSLFHHTIPFESKSERICFVFDLTPAKNL